MLRFSFLSYCVIMAITAFGQDEAPVSIRIDPYNAVGSTAGQTFDEVIYTPLETSGESLFGSVDQLVVTDKFFIIKDRNTNCILLFFKDGKFHCKIRGGDVGNNQLNEIHSFSVNRSKNEIAFKRGRDRMLYYDFNGKKLREERAVVGGMTFRFFSRDAIVFLDYNVNKLVLPDSINYELKYTRNNKVYATSFPYNMQSGPLPSGDISYPDHSPFYEIGNDTAVLYWRPYNYGIYMMTPNRVKEIYRFVFPLANSLPDNFVANAAFYGKRWDYISSHPSVIYNASYTYKIGDNLFFKLNTLDAGLRNNDSFIYNLRSGDLISVTHITADSSNYFLPVSDDGIFSVEFARRNFLTSDGAYVYTSYSSLLMFNVRDATKNKNITYSPVLMKYFTQETKKSNPVIVQFKPKENL